MEKIYKPETEDAGKVEVYSRENNDMLGDMPQWLIHTGSYIVYGLIVVFPAIYLHLTRRCGLLPTGKVYLLPNPVLH